MLVLLVDVITAICGDNSLEAACDELEKTVAEVAEVCEQFIIVLGNEIVPEEDGVLVLWSVNQQVVSPHFRWDASLHSVVAKNSDSTGLGELERLLCDWVKLVVEELGRRHVVQLGPGHSRANQS